MNVVLHLVKFTVEVIYYYSTASTVIDYKLLTDFDWRQNRLVEHMENLYRNVVEKEKKIIKKDKFNGGIIHFISMKIKEN